MVVEANEYHIVAFDPGGTIGWAHLVLDIRAFSRPEHRALDHLKWWNCGEFEGTETEQIALAAAQIHLAHFGPMPFNTRTDVISENFELTQLLGGATLLSPVRINAILDWICRTQHGFGLHLQARAMRTNVTKDRLKAMGFDGRFRKDEFAAMQHAVTWLRRTKRKSLTSPWKLGDENTRNSYWDCACEEGNVCDLRHL